MQTMLVPRLDHAPHARRVTRVPHAGFQVPGARPELVYGTCGGLRQQGHPSYSFDAAARWLPWPWSTGGVIRDEEGKTPTAKHVVEVRRISYVYDVLGAFALR